MKKLKGSFSDKYFHYSNHYKETTEAYRKLSKQVTVLSFHVLLLDLMLNEEGISRGVLNGDTEERNEVPRF